MAIEHVDRMSAAEFERYVAQLLKRQGFRARITAHTGDFGVDVVAEKGDVRHAVQVKHTSGSISQPAVREVVAGKAVYRCTAAMVVTNGNFSETARALAKMNEVELVDRRALEQWIAAHDRKGGLRGLWNKQLIGTLIAVLIALVLCRLMLDVAERAWISLRPAAGAAPPSASVEGQSPPAARPAEPTVGPQPGIVQSKTIALREGPGPTYAVVTLLFEGQAVRIVARNAESTWFLVEVGQSQQGWVLAPEVRPNETLESIPVIGVAVTPAIIYNPNFPWRQR